MSPDPRAAADMTTDEIAADVRTRMAANPTHAAALQGVADRLVRTIRDRLPYIEPADAGAVMVNLGAYITHALELFIGYGEGAIYDQARTLAETVTWPDEQQPEFECEVCTKPITAYPCVLCEHEPDPWKKPDEQQPADDVRWLLEQLERQQPEDGDRG